MKIAFICDYFFPHSPGGAEQSAFVLAQSLKAKGLDVSIITPNYGAKRYESIKKIKIYRYPFIKLKKGKTKVSPLFHTNLFWILYSTFQIYKILKKQKITLVHIHGKFSLPGALIAAKLLRVKTIATFRDYRILCPIGYCLFNKLKTNNFLRFLTQEIPFGIKHYVRNENWLSIFIYCLANIRAYFFTKVLKFAATLVDRKIFVSRKVKKIYNQNGIRGGRVIYNLLPPRLSPGLGLKSLRSRPGLEDWVLYVGKLSYGKGTDLFLKTAKKLEKIIPQYQFAIVGNANLKKYQNLAKKLKLKKVKFLGPVPHQKIKKFYQKAKLVVIPSRWQEPLSRVTLEALSLGVPIVSTKKGGQAEIIKNGKNGYLTKAEVESLTSAIQKGIKENQTLRASLERMKKNFQDKFYTQVINQHLKLYKDLIQ